MINGKLSDLIAANSPTGGELIYIVQGGNSRQLALGAVGAKLLDDTGYTGALTSIGVTALGRSLLDDTGQTTALTTLGVTPLMRSLLNDTGQTTALTTLGGGVKGRAIFQDTGSTAVLAELGFSALMRDLHDDTGQTTAISTLGITALNYHKKVNVLWATDPAFGAGTGTGNDDSTALQAWLSACEADGIMNAYLPPTADGYNLGSEISTTTAGGGMMIYSDVAGSSAGGAKVVIGFDGIGIDVAGTLTKVKGIRFSSNRTLYPASKALRFAKTANTDDMDALAEDCEFENFFAAIDQNGRGLYARRNIFALCDNCIAINWPSSGVVADTGDVLHDLPYGYRKWIITDNHFHSVGVAVKNFSTNAMRGALIANNMMDIGRKLWEGPIINSLIQGNVCENLSTYGIEITGAGGSGVSVIGNYLAGMTEPGGGDGGVHQPQKGIFFNVSGSTTGANVSNNIIDLCSQDGIRFHRAIIDCVVNGNILRSYNTDGDTGYAGIIVNNASGLTNSVVRSVVQANTGPAPSVGAFWRATGNIVNSIVDNIHAVRTDWS